MSQIPLFGTPTQAPPPAAAPEPPRAPGSIEPYTRDTLVRAPGQDGPGLYTWGEVVDATMAALGWRP